MKRLAPIALVLALFAVAFSAPAQAACTTAFPTSTKQELLLGTHVIGTDTIKFGIKTSSATDGASTTAWSATNEVTTGSGYSTGGYTATCTASTSGTTAIVDCTDITQSNVTFTDGACGILYNSSKSNKVLGVWQISPAVAPSAGTLTIDFPATGASTSTLRIAFNLDNEQEREAWASIVAQYAERVAAK